MCEEEKTNRRSVPLLSVRTLAAESCFCHKLFLTASPFVRSCLSYMSVCCRLFRALPSSHVKVYVGRLHHGNETTGDTQECCKAE